MENIDDYMLEHGQIGQSTFGEESHVHINLYLNQERGTPLAGLDVCEDSLQDHLVRITDTTDVKTETKDICEGLDIFEAMTTPVASPYSEQLPPELHATLPFEAMATHGVSPDSQQLTPEPHATLPYFPKTTVQSTERDEKKILRAQRNRQSAQESRQRKRDKDTLLREKIREHEQNETFLKAKIETQDARIRELEQKNLKFQNEVLQKTQIKTLHSTIQDLEQKDIELQNAVKAKQNELQLLTQKIEFVLVSCKSEGFTGNKRQRASAKG
jgi:hypothetical protein